MPFFGKKSEKKKSDEVSYPRQTPCNSPHPQLQEQFHHHQQQQAFYQNSVPNTSVVHVITRTENPSFMDRLFDGPDYHNTIRDPTIPPAPGTYIVVAPSQPAPPPPPPPQFMRPPQPPAPYSQQQGPSSSSAGPSFPPPPSYEDVLAQEIKKKL